MRDGVLNSHPEGHWGYSTRDWLKQGGKGKRNGTKRIERKSSPLFKKDHYLLGCIIVHRKLAGEIKVREASVQDGRGS